ncbi:MAG: hypothetical protein CVU49_02645 [Candidatus Cloacimonetes bacterium HGW-Cloacimonetes-2]|jgi:hypothetical protein|nr:MAG: hypothetical protein CVU49_02645 [Candidatus Cloacimonetes bacterium HGW-Cloacimonetes-2]
MCKVYNVYCDESCHLENDGQKSMVIGAVWVDREHVRSISTDIKAYIVDRSRDHQRLLKEYYCFKMANAAYL